PFEARVSSATQSGPAGASMRPIWCSLYSPLERTSRSRSNCAPKAMIGRIGDATAGGPEYRAEDTWASPHPLARPQLSRTGFFALYCEPQAVRVSASNPTAYQRIRLPRVRAAPTITALGPACATTSGRPVGARGIQRNTAHRRVFGPLPRVWRRGAAEP